MAAISSCCASGLHASWRPQSTRVGHRIARNTPPASGRARSASICAANRSGVWRSIMSRIGVIRASSASARRMHHGLDPDPAHRAHALLPRERQERQTRRAFVLAGTLCRPGAPAGVEQREALHALRRPADHLRGRPVRPSSARRARRTAARSPGRARPSLRGSTPGRFPGPGIRRTRERRGSTGSHAARSQTRPGSSSSTPSARRRREGAGRRFRAHDRVEPARVLQAPRAEAFTARAVREPKRENTRRALPSKILARSAALSHSIGSR